MESVRRSHVLQLPMLLYCTCLYLLILHLDKNELKDTQYTFLSFYVHNELFLQIRCNNWDHLSIFLPKKSSLVAGTWNIGGTLFSPAFFLWHILGLFVVVRWFVGLVCERSHSKCSCRTFWANVHDIDTCNGRKLDSVSKEVPSSLIFLITASHW